MMTWDSWPQNVFKLRYFGENLSKVYSVTYGNVTNGKNSFYLETKHFIHISQVKNKFKISTEN